MGTLWSEDDAKSWHPGLSDTEGGEARVLDAWRAAEAYVARRCRWADTNPDGVPVDPPADLRLAVRMLTARLLARHNSPEGLAAGGGDLGPARIAYVDPDIRGLMGPWIPVVI